MAIEERLEQISVDAGANFVAADQFKAVKLGTDGRAVLVTAITDLPIGILQDISTTGHAVPVAVGGIVKAKAGATIAAGAQVAVKADGTLQTAVTTQYVIGTARWGAANGDIFSVHLQPAIVKA
jgi:Uncharacterized conserved protein (DUF2190)